MAFNLSMQVTQPPVGTELNPILLAWLINFVQIYNAQIVPAPSAANSMGTAGQMSYDTSYFYMCVAKNTWLRVAIATW